MCLLGILECALKLRSVATLRQSKHCLGHPIACLSILGIRLKDFRALLHNIVILLQVELAQREISSESNFDIFGDLLAVQFQVASEHTDGSLIFLACILQFIFFE